jgi:autotransporter-associated beta strand protein
MNWKSGSSILSPSIRQIHHLRRIFALGVISISPWAGFNACFGETLFTYTFSDVTNTSGTSSAGDVITGATLSDFTAVGTPANANAGGRFSFTNWSTGATNGSNTFTGAIALAEYYQFTITPSIGFGLDLESISFTIQRSGTGIRQYSVRSELDGYSSNLPAAISGTTTALSVVELPEANIFQITDATTTAVNGSTVALGAAYSAVTSAVTFRFYGWNAEAVTGTFSIDNVAISGSVFSTAASSYWDANGTGPGLGGTGQWTAANWGDKADGTGQTHAFNPAERAVFAGASGTVMIGAAGVAANAGMRFESDGYNVSSEGGGILTVGGGAPLLEVMDPSHRATISAPLAGTGGITKRGQGTLVLAGVNSFSGPTRITEGTLAISQAANLGQSTAISLDGGILQSTSTITLGASRTLSGSGTIDVAAGTVLTFDGSVSLGTIALTNSGEARFTGTQAAIAALTISSATTVTSGLGGSAALGIGGNITTTHADGIVTFNGPINAGAAVRNYVIADGSAPEDVFFNGRISGTGRIEFSGPSTAAVRLNADNATAVGGFRLSAGGPTLVVGHPAALGSTVMFFNGGTLSFPSPTTVATPLSIGGVVSIVGSDAVFTGDTGLFGTAPKILNIRNNVTLTGKFGTPGNAAGDVTLLGGGTVTLANSSNQHTGQFTIAEGTLKLSGTLSGSLSVGDNSGIEDATLVLSPGAITSSGSLFGLSILSDAVLRLEIDSSLQTADHFVVTGPVLLGQDVAKLEITDLGSRKLPVGFQLTLIDNFSLSATGTFAGLPHLADFNVGVNVFEIDYGIAVDAMGIPINPDVVLRVVPEPGLTSLLLAAGAILAGVRSRRRR